MQLRATRFDALPHWSPEELTAVWPTYLASCRAVVENRSTLRPGALATPEMVGACACALALSEKPESIERYFYENFRACEVTRTPDSSGFLTGYYEPEIDGSIEPTGEFPTPILNRPSDLIDMRGVNRAGWDRLLEGARLGADGQLEPYPDRAAIETGAIDDIASPSVWVRDAVEAFFVQVQGSARIRLPNGETRRLVYAGRNGRPYSSIGRMLIESGEISADEMSLARCKLWLRENGLEIGSRGRSVMQANQSYVFFRLEEDRDVARGPIGGQGLPLTPMRSIAVDRKIWPYGSLVWLAADLSSAGVGDGPAGRLMVAQDTGSAIVGAARADVFIGSGPRAGDIAGLIRHSSRFFVFMPLESRSNGAP